MSISSQEGRVLEDLWAQFDDAAKVGDFDGMDDVIELTMRRGHEFAGLEMKSQRDSIYSNGLDPQEDIREQLMFN